MAKEKSGAQQGKDAAAKPAAAAAGKPPVPPSTPAVKRPPVKAESHFAPLIADVRAAAEHPRNMGHLHAADLKRWELLHDAALALAAAAERET